MIDNTLQAEPEKQAEQTPPAGEASPPRRRKPNRKKARRLFHREKRRNDKSEPAADGDSFPPVRRRSSRRVQVVRSILLLIGIFVTSVLVFILVSGIADNRDFELTFYQVSSLYVDHPMRIALLTDLHNHEYGKNNSELLDSIEAVNPDLICMVGDMMNNYQTDYHVVLDLIHALQERDIAPIYYAYGNHEADYIYSVSDQLDKDIKATGVKVLRNSYESIEVAENTVSVAALTTKVEDYDKYGAPAMMQEFQSAPGFRLLLAHYPHYFTSIFKGENAIDVDLALCGHAHGGIIRIPKLGGLYASGQGILPDLTEGVARYGSCTVVVSRGLGGRKFPIRLNDKPELVVVDISRMG